MSNQTSIAVVIDLQDGVYTIVFPAGVTELPPARGRGVNS
jgi:hypothetical protein